MIYLFKNKTRTGFSMLELVFVITILGIVSSLGSEIIVKVYQSYIVQRSTSRSSIKTELVALQIANRLSASISRTVIGRVSLIDRTYRSIDELNGGNFQVLEWIGYDIDGFRASLNTLTPGWSGLADINSPNTSKNFLTTPGSSLVFTKEIIKALSTNLTNMGGSALFFPGVYSPYSIGYDGNITGLSIIATQASNTRFSLNPIPVVSVRVIKEHYKLAWSAYAIVPVVQANGLWELRLYYDLQPWVGRDYDNDQRSAILLRNVSVFQFTGTDNSIRFKICQQELTGNINPITTCKEKVVVR